MNKTIILLGYILMFFYIFAFNEELFYWPVHERALFFMFGMGIANIVNSRTER